MVNCRWTRLSYLLFALTILIAIAQVRDPSTDPRALARTPSGTTVEEDAPASDVGSGEPAQTARGEDAAHTASIDGEEGDRPSTTVVGAADTGPPVFYRPAPASLASGAHPACADLGVFPTNRRIAFPLPRSYLGSYEDTWGAPRPQGGHEGTDLMAPTGTAAYAVTDGTIVAVAGANENGWNTLGGYSVMVRAAYSVGPVKRGDLFYYAHLNHESALEIGTRVSAGQTVGYVGDTGQGPEVTRGLFPPHLHLGWYGAGSTVISGAMNPYPLLEWIKANGGAITGGSGARYCEVPRFGGPVPSAGESRWPAPGSPGVRPDLATGASQPGPAPAQQGGPPPGTRQPDVPGGTAPKIGPPPEAGVPGGEHPWSSSGEVARDNPSAPSSGAGPRAGGVNDPPGEDTQKERGDDGADAPEDEPETRGPEEDSQPIGEQTTPGGDQYAPEAGEESDPETTAG